MNVLSLLSWYLLQFSVFLYYNYLTCRLKERTFFPILLINVSSILFYGILFSPASDAAHTRLLPLSIVIGLFFFLAIISLYTLVTCKKYHLYISFSNVWFSHNSSYRISSLLIVLVALLRLCEAVITLAYVDYVQLRVCSISRFYYVCNDM
jgi:hypothetical protein